MSILKVTRLMMEARRNSKEYPQETDVLSDCKVTSGAIKKNSQQLRYGFLVVILLLVALAAVDTTSLAFSLKQNKQSSSFVNNTANEPTESPSPLFGKQVAQKEQVRQFFSHSILGDLQLGSLANSL